MPELGGSYFTFSNENNDLIWGFLAECHRRGWLYKGHDTMPWCARCGTGISPDGDERGLPGPRGPRPDRPPAARRPARRGAARLDDHALDPDRPTSWPRSGRTCATSRSARATSCLLARQGDPQAGARRARSRCSRRRRGAELVGWRYAGPVRRPAGGPRAFAAGDDRPAYEHRVVAWDEVGEVEGTGIVHIAPGCGAEDYAPGQGARAAHDRAARRGRHLPRRLRLPDRARRARRDRADRRRTCATPGRFYRLAPYQPPLPALLALRHAARLPPRRRVVHLDGPGLRPAARDADGGAGRRQPALPDHGAWSTTSAGSPASATSASSTGCATCTTG